MTDSPASIPTASPPKTRWSTISRLREADRRPHPLRRRGHGPAARRPRAPASRPKPRRRDRGQQRRRRHRPVPAPHHSRRRAAKRDPADPFHRLPQSRPAARGCGAGGGRRLFGRPDRRRTSARGQARVSVGRPARPAAQTLSRQGFRAGGWACWASGTRRPVDPARNMSRSRSAAPMADIPSTSAASPPAASRCWAGRRPSRTG